MDCFDNTALLRSCPFVSCAENSLIPLPDLPLRRAQCCGPSPVPVRGPTVPLCRIFRLCFNPVPPGLGL